MGTRREGHGLGKTKPGEQNLRKTREREKKRKQKNIKAPVPAPFPSSLAQIKQKIYFSVLLEVGTAHNTEYKIL